MNTITTVERSEEVYALIDQKRRENNIACIPAKAIFYDASGTEVWSCTKDMRYHLSNGTKAMNKGAVRGVLVNLKGEKLEELEYRS